jgi:hypothetical protein
VEQNAISPSVLMPQEQGSVRHRLLTSEEGCYCLPALAHVLRAGEEEHLERSVERINTMIE